MYILAQSLNCYEWTDTAALVTVSDAQNLQCNEDKKFSRNIKFCKIYSYVNKLEI